MPTVRYVVQFAEFDARGYRTVDVRTGYGQWVGTYEQTVQDVMDLALLRQLRRPPWSAVRHAVDLGCGTGRTGRWLHRHGVASIDGVDMTPEMLARARARGVHERLVEADVTETGLPAACYDLVIASLLDEHLAELAPLYAEAFRLAEPGGLFVMVAFHPHFIMTTGMPTHFTTEAGEPVAITTHVHLLSEQVTAGLEAGWALAEMHEGVVDEAWLAVKPKWRRYRGHPVSAALVWRKPEPAPL
ncbi:class I SAM-dependent methyltransferase [Pseudonocardia sp.]|uniref:class I SAM-dependent DNA methyltransferase n=1 Tax=Pseudonocardia sp. TaxID=60912 RepID=UPI002F3EA238